MTNVSLQEIAERIQMKAGSCKTNFKKIGKARAIKDFEEHFDGVPMAFITFIFFTVLVLQYTLGGDGYRNLAQVLIGDEIPTAEKLQLMILGLAIFSAAVTIFCGHLLSSFDERIRSWHVTKAIQVGGSAIMGARRVEQSLFWARTLGVVLSLAFLSMTIYGLTVRSEIIEKANGTAQVIPMPELLDEVFEGLQPNTNEAIEPSDNLTKKLSNWSIALFSFGLLVEFLTGIYLVLWLGYLVKKLLAGLSVRSNTIQFNGIVSGDTLVLSLVKEKLGEDASETEILKYQSGAVRACCTRALYGNAESAESYFGPKIQGEIDVETNFSTNGDSAQFQQTFA